MLSHPSRTVAPARLALVILLTVIAGPAIAQPQRGGPIAAPAIAQPQRGDGPRPITAADYARAERFLGPTVNPLVIGGSVTANWLPDDRFWYRNQVDDGYEFILVTPATKTRRPAFDHAKLAAALSAAAKGTFTAHQLPFTSIDLSPDALNVSFDHNGRRWTCDVQGAACADSGAALGRADAGGRGGSGRGAAGRGGTAGSAAGRAGHPPGGLRAGRRDPRRAVARREARGLHPRLESLDPRHGDGPGAPADEGRREVLRLRHRQRRLEQQRSRHRALVARLDEDRHLPAGRARGRRDVSRQHARRSGHAPDAARLEVPAAGRPRHGHAPPRRHRRRERRGRAVPDAARLSPRDAGRRCQPARLAVEAGRQRAGVHLDVARPQGSGAARRRHGHGRRPHGDAGEGRDAV